MAPFNSYVAIILCERSGEANKKREVVFTQEIKINLKYSTYCK